MRFGVREHAMGAIGNGLALHKVSTASKTCPSNAASCTSRFGRRSEVGSPCSAAPPVHLHTQSGLASDLGCDSQMLPCTRCWIQHDDGAVSACRAA